MSEVTQTCMCTSTMYNFEITSVFLVIIELDGMSGATYICKLMQVHFRILA